jgi:sugar/nucleoside kinase (ribokinase family)
VCADRLTLETVTAARQARRTGCFTALDLGGTAGLSRRNRHELVAWAGEFDLVSLPLKVASWLTDGEISDFVRSVRSNRTAALALTKGPDGFDLFLRGEDDATSTCTSAAPDAEPVVDACGAGDAFMAALIACTVQRGIPDERAHRLRYCTADRDAMVAALREAPVTSLGGMGARAAFPEGPDHGRWSMRLSLLRGRILDELRRQFADVRPCCFCGSG